MKPVSSDLLPKLVAVQDQIVACERCSRLRSYCARVAEVKKRAYINDTYWARPVPGFGDPNARLLIMGLAPAAHGANRTGRVFTGDGVGASGDFLMAALHRAGLANIATSHTTDDGLTLTDVYIAASVRCAPPDNKPLPEEIDRCLPHMQDEVAHLPNIKAIVTLGKIAWDAYWKLLAMNGDTIPRPRPVFGHGVVFEHLAPRTFSPSGPRTLIGAYHPSRQNTNTGVVTPKMYDDVFRKARRAIG